MPVDGEAAELLMWTSDFPLRWRVSITTGVRSRAKGDGNPLKTVSDEAYKPQGFNTLAAKRPAAAAATKEASSWSRPRPMVDSRTGLEASASNKPVVSTSRS